VPAHHKPDGLGKEKRGGENATEHKTAAGKKTKKEGVKRAKGNLSEEGDRASWDERVISSKKVFPLGVGKEALGGSIP